MVTVPEKLVPPLTDVGTKVNAVMRGAVTFRLAFAAVPLVVSVK